MDQRINSVAADLVKNGRIGKVACDVADRQVAKRIGGAVDRDNVVLIAERADQRPADETSRSGDEDAHAQDSLGFFRQARCMEAGGAPGSVLPDPDLRNKSAHRDAFIDIAAFNGVGHCPRHHRSLIGKPADGERTALDLQKAQKAPSMAEKFGLTLHDSGGVDMDQVIGHQIGECRHIVIHQSIAPRAFALGEFTDKRFISHVRTLSSPAILPR